MKVDADAAAVPDIETPLLPPHRPIELASAAAGGKLSVASWWNNAGTVLCLLYGGTLLFMAVVWYNKPAPSRCVVSVSAVGRRESCDDFRSKLYGDDDAVCDVHVSHDIPAHETTRFGEVAFAAAYDGAAYPPHQTSQALAPCRDIAAPGDLQRCGVRVGAGAGVVRAEFGASSFVTHVARLTTDHFNLTFSTLHWPLSDDDFGRAAVRCARRLDWSRVEFECECRRGE